MKRQTHKLFLIAALIGTLLVSSQDIEGQGATKAAPKQTPAKTLYQRLGGYDAIAAVVDDFIARLITDTQVSRFFTGHSLASKKRIRQFIVEQVCMVAGGPCFYTGRTMKESHEGLNIAESDWDTTVKHLVASLNKFGVPQKEKDELLSAISSLKPDIVAPK